MGTLGTWLRKSGRRARHGGRRGGNARPIEGMRRRLLAEGLEPRLLMAVLTNDTATTPEDVLKNINVVANDTDILPGAAVQVITPPSHGTVVPAPGNTFNYTPAANYSGLDAFTYGVIDNPPQTTANDDTAVTLKNVAKIIHILGNDTDPQNDPLTPTILTGPAFGTAVLNADKTVTYTPNTDYTGLDSFTYEISDGNGHTDTATVKVDVRIALNAGTVHYLAPILSTASKTTHADKPADLWINTDDPQGASGTISVPGGATVSFTVTPTTTDIRPLSVGFGRTLNLNTVESKGLVVNSNRPVNVAIVQEKSNGQSYLVSKGLSALGTDFRVGQMSEVDAYENNNGSIVSVMATVDNTTVSIAAPPGGTWLNQPAGPVVVTLNAGQTYMVMTNNPAVDITGTRVTSSKPISVSSGSFGATFFTGSNPAADNGWDQMVPVERVGNHYVFIGSNSNPDTGDFVATQNGTEIRRNNVLVATINAGQVYRVDLSGSAANEIIDIKASKPVYGFQTSGRDLNRGENAMSLMAPINPSSRGVWRFRSPDPVNVDDFVAFLTTTSAVGTFTVTDLTTGLPVALSAPQLVPGDPTLSVVFATVPSSHEFKAQANAFVQITIYAASPNNGGGIGYYGGFASTDLFAADDNIATFQDTPITFDPRVNDADGAGDSISISNLGSASHGTVVDNGNGTLTYTPSNGYVGNDSFLYTVTDGTGNFSTATVFVTVSGLSQATVNITVTPIADAVPFSASDVTGHANTDLPVAISVGNSPDTDGSETPPAVVILRNYPANLTFSAGSPLVASAGWSVPLASLGSLKVRSTTVGDFSVTAEITNRDTATIPGAASLTDTKTFTTNFTVHITNNAPNIANQVFSVDENSADGTAVGTVVANDPDAVDTITYAITGGNTGSTFAINSATGQITVANGANLDYETTPVYDLTVTVTDNLGAATSATVRINVNNLRAVLSITGFSDSEGNSGTKTFTFDVTASGVVKKAFSVNYATANGTAGDGTAGTDSDYMAKSGKLDFAGTDGQTLTISVSVRGDTKVEANESFEVLLSGITGNDVAFSTSKATGTIVNDDTATVSITGGSVAEGNSGTANLPFTISVSNPIDAAISVSFSTSDLLAVAPGDYAAQSNVTVNIPAGTTSVTRNVLVQGDTIVERDETLTGAIANLNASGRAVSLGSASAVGTILNDDGATISIAGSSVQEGNSGTKNLPFTITLSNPVDALVSVSFATADGTAVAPGDYTAQSSVTVSIPAGTTSVTQNVVIQGDTTVELNETFTAGIGSLSASGRNVTLGTTTATGTILNDDSATVSITGSQVLEGNSGTTSLPFTVSLSSPVDVPVTVSFATANGTAVAPGDYTSQSAVTVAIPAGQTTVVQNVLVNGDTLVEPDETLSGSISGLAAGGRSVTLATTSATGTIVNDDRATVSLARGADGAEPATNGQFIVTLSQNSSTATTVNYTVAGTATPGVGNDYQTLSGSVTIPANTSSTTITVFVQDDFLVEPTETVIATLGAITSGNAGITVNSSASTATVNITDNDVATVAIRREADAAEPSTQGRFVVTLSAFNSTDTVITYTIAGTAIEGTDYQDLTGTVIIPAQAFSTSIDVPVLDDLLVEGTETVIVTLTSVSSGNATVLASQSTATVNIIDNDRSRGGCDGTITLADGVLTIIGTDYADKVSINKAGDKLRVHASFLRDHDHDDEHDDEHDDDHDDDAEHSKGWDDDDDHEDDEGFVSFNFSSVKRIVATMCAGNDHVVIAGNIKTTASIDGGAGRDHLKAGAGPSILGGGDGDDFLNGGSGRSILIGGFGSDRLVGGPNDNILIGGTSTYATHDNALLDILAEWNSERSYSERVKNISGPGTGSRLNGTSYLRKPTTVADDGDRDCLTGAAGQDWFFAKLQEDSITDRKPNEILS